MQVQTHDVDVTGKAGVVRCAVARPTAQGTFPLLLCFADIFGNSEAHLRVMRRLAGHGYVVASPEPWARFLPTGTVLDFDKDRQRALDASERGDGAAADEDRAAVIAAFKGEVFVDDAVFAIGFCYGGHLAFRAALDPGAVRASVCCYGTGIHADKLGGGAVDSLSRAKEIEGDLLLVWGRDDPHIPKEGRAKIHAALDAAGVRWEARLYDAAHAFARDVGPRYDPAATDAALGEALALFARRR
jgi:carboxymethylenebutenolidase